jgi:hypothetical protein
MAMILILIGKNIVKDVHIDGGLSFQRTYEL